MNSFPEKVTETISEYKMLENAGKIAVALSGGADSVSLLRVLKFLEEPLGISVCACHLNHGLRGEESDADERFCRELCARLDIPLGVKRVNIAEQREKHESVEETARRVRYGFFCEYLEQLGENAVLATAHTASDNAETVLFNLVRGTGMDGLCGIPPKRKMGKFRVIRPLINCTRNEIENYLEELKQTYVTDKTNLSDEYSRNRIRLNVLPELSKINPAAVEAITRMTKHLRRDNELFDELAENALREARTDRGWKASELARLPEPIKARALRKILIMGGIQPSSLRIKTASSLLEKRSARYNPCKDRFFTIRKGVCFTERIEQHFHGYNEKNSHKM